MTFVCNLNLSLSDRFCPVSTQIFSHKLENNETQKLNVAVGQEAKSLCLAHKQMD